MVDKSAGIVIVKLNHNDVRMFSIESVASLLIAGAPSCTNTDSFELLRESPEKIFSVDSKEQVKGTIESIPAEILQRVIGKFSRRIRNCIVARGRLFEK